MTTSTRPSLGTAPDSSQARVFQMRVGQVVKADRVLLGVALACAGTVMLVMFRMEGLILGAFAVLYTLTMFSLLVLITPRAVRVEGSRLRLERPLFSKTLEGEVQQAGPGPALGSLPLRSGRAGRIGGYRNQVQLAGLGRVQVWAASLEADSVLVVSRTGEKWLVGVDDGPGLIHALNPQP